MCIIVGLRCRLANGNLPIMHEHAEPCGNSKCGRSVDPGMPWQCKRLVKTTIFLLFILTWAPPAYLELSNMRLELISSWVA